MEGLSVFSLRSISKTKLFFTGFNFFCNRLHPFVLFIQISSQFLTRWPQAFVLTPYSLRFHQVCQLESPAIMTANYVCVQMSICRNHNYFDERQTHIYVLSLRPFGGVPLLFRPSRLSPTTQNKCWSRQYSFLKINCKSAFFPRSQHYKEATAKHGDRQWDER